MNTIFTKNFYFKLIHNIIKKNVTLITSTSYLKFNKSCRV